MTTDRSQIEATLRQLQSQLAESSDIDPQVKERLAAMQAEILSNLQDSPASKTSSARHMIPVVEKAEEIGGSPLTRRLADAALYFEESHPQLSTTIGSLAGIIGQMGF